MPNIIPIEPVDYLVIGHLTVDVTPNGNTLGGSAAYAALTARALGLRVGIVTAWGNEMVLDSLSGIQIVSAPAERSTTFENRYTTQGRVQTLHHRAPKINFDSVPDKWKHAPVIHLAPVAQEMDPILPSSFRPSLLGLTPQGWMRTWDSDHRVMPCKWENADAAIQQAGAVVFSAEDVQGDEHEIESIMLSSRVLAVTEGLYGARLYWNHDLRRFNAPKVNEVDPTGAGDIFAASFFVRLYNTRDPWEAARFANHMAAISVTRPGMSGVPTAAEVHQCLMEVLR